VLISSGLATMGYAVPAAVGAALARPDQRVFCFVGDGGLGMVLGELETIARLRLAVTVIVFNDASLSLIRVKQRPAGHGDERAVRFSPVDFAAVARGLGLSSTSVRTTDELATALAEDVAGPRLLDVLVDPDTYRHVIDVTRNGKLG
jgi:acetolactate synthase-1/2/3 large subunit